jgi:hypothetical protein
VDGLEVIAVSTLRDAIVRALEDDDQPRGEPPFGDARLTARAEPIVGAGVQASRRGSR